MKSSCSNRSSSQQRRASHYSLGIKFRCCSSSNSIATGSLLWLVFVAAILSTSTTLAWVTVPSIAQQGPSLSRLMATPTSTTSSSSNTLFSTERTIRGDTNMFVTTTTTTTTSGKHIALPTARGTVYRWKRHYDGKLEECNSVQRGTLGFFIDEIITSSWNPSSSALSSSTRHNVDSSAWNGARAWDLNDNDNPTTSSFTTDSTTRQNNHDNKNNNNHPRRRRLLWSNFSPPYNVVDRVKMERTDLNIADWQKELLEQGMGNDDDDDVDDSFTTKNFVDWLQDDNEDDEDNDDDEQDDEQDDANPSVQSTNKKQPKTNTVNSLAEWVRTVDLEPLLQRREEIHYEKRHGKKRRQSSSDTTNSAGISSTNHTTLSREDLVQSLTKLLDDSSHSKYSNLEIKQMYAAAKLADQQGQFAVAQQILQQLIEATPQDARLYRRLARLHKQQGQWTQARAVLQQGLRVHPQNAYLWHGMAQMAATQDQAKQAYRRAIRCDPYFPHTYHALGTMEHSQGRIANAMQTLKQGIEYCPTNHRLHHALGDLYREAKMLSMAEKSYHKALQFGTDAGRGFCYTALAFVAYERDQVDVARQWLHKATQLNHGRHANAWKSLANLEEAQGNVKQARRICETALNRYEKGLLAYHRKQQKEKTTNDRNDEKETNAVSVKNALLQNVPVYRSGDRFFQVYRTWARLEERYGTLESAEAVYERATAAFPHNTQIVLDWVDLYVRLGLPDRARQVFGMACGGSTKSAAAAAYRRFAEFEMSKGAHNVARKILFRGALRLSQDGGKDNDAAAELYHTWAVCEWHLGNEGRAEILLDHALRLTPAGAQGSKLRSFFLYTLARLQHYRGEYLLAQHCVALCLKENVGSTAKLWDLWADVASALDNPFLQEQCLEQAALTRSSEDLNEVSPLLLRSTTPGFQDMMRRDPWHYKIYKSGTAHSDRPFAYGVQLPQLDEATMAVEP